MPLSLLVFRHAKSGWEASSDHERTLTERGQQQALFMGDLLKEKNITPDFILCSSAVRARMTMDLAMSTGEWECDSNITEALYNTTVENTLQIIKQLSDQDKVVMLIGHEPTWSELTTCLTSESASF
ncbi:MAG: histidine phosphatase family protein, partial [Gammaproteobacteria bacterium]|nr:histidine phosphatase family protein [Gammaproteobacteria bacterium]